MQEVRGGERARSHACQVDLQIDVVGRVACIGNDHGVAATLVIADTVRRHRTWCGYERCVTSDAGDRCEVDLVGGMGETNNGVEVARARQRVNKRFEQEGILPAPPVSKSAPAPPVIASVAVTPTQVIGKARAGDGVGTATAIDKGEAGDRAKTAQVECVGSPSANNAVAVALPRLNRRGRGVEAGKRDIAGAGDQNAVGSGPTIHGVVLSFGAGDHKGVVTVAAVQRVGTRSAIERVVAITTAQGVVASATTQIVGEA